MNIDLLKVDFSKYESPIQKIVGEMQNKIIDQETNYLVTKVSQEVGFSVDKEELLKALQYDRDQYRKGYEDGLKADKWIPISEKLPEIGQRVLVTYNQEDKLKVDTTIFDRHGFLIGVVTAWMPLPQPYREIEE